MNLKDASKIRLDGSDVKLIKLDGVVIYEAKEDEPVEQEEE